MATKYRINERHLSDKHGIARLERDGFSRDQISKAVYANTPGCTTQERRELVKNLFDRKGEC